MPHSVSRGATTHSWVSATVGAGEGSGAGSAGWWAWAGTSLSSSVTAVSAVLFGVGAGQLADRHDDVDRGVGHGCDGQQDAGGRDNL